MTFVRRKIDLDIVLGQGAFGEGGEDTVTLTGHRVSADITNVYGPGMGQAAVRLWGLRKDLLAKVSSLNQATEALRRNRLVLRAGDEVTGMSTVFDGTITLSQFDANAQPEVALNIIAHSGLFEAVKPTAGLSYRGAADAAVILANIAQVAGLVFENSGVSAILRTPALKGTAREMIESICQAVQADFVIEGKTLAVWPKGGKRDGMVPLISPKTGLVGYPAYGSSAQGRQIVLTTLFNPAIRNGGMVKVESDLDVANGEWQTFKICHELDAELPNGHWYTRCMGIALNGR